MKLTMKFRTIVLVGFFLLDAPDKIFSDTPTEFSRLLDKISGRCINGLRD